MSSAPTPAPSPLTISRFIVQFEGANPVSVAEVAGIEVDIAVVETREGNQLTSAQKQPGQASYPNLILRRPLTGDLSLWNWLQQTLSGAPSARNVIVRLLNSQESPVLTWAFRNAFPVKWTGPALNALSNDVAIETLELAHEGFTLSGS
jgi:phage tail-like protein